MLGIDCLQAVARKVGVHVLPEPGLLVQRRRHPAGPAWATDEVAEEVSSVAHPLVCLLSAADRCCTSLVLAVLVCASRARLRLSVNCDGCVCEQGCVVSEEVGEQDEKTQGALVAMRRRMCYVVWKKSSAHRHAHAQQRDGQAEEGGQQDGSGQQHACIAPRHAVAFKQLSAIKVPGARLAALLRSDDEDQAVTFTTCSPPGIGMRVQVSSCLCLCLSVPSLHAPDSNNKDGHGARRMRHAAPCCVQPSCLQKSGLYVKIVGRQERQGWVCWRPACCLLLAACCL